MARTRFLFFIRPQRSNRIRLGRQPSLAGSPAGRQIYLSLHRPEFLQTLGTGTQLDQRRRRRWLAIPLLPLRSSRYTARDDRHPRQSGLVRQLHRLEPAERGRAGLQGCESAVQTAKSVCRP